jgi:hypothetical protein
MLQTKQLGYEFWVEAVHTTIYTLNNYLTRVVLDLTLDETWLGYRPIVAYLDALHTHMLLNKIGRNWMIKILSAFLLGIA